MAATNNANIAAGVKFTLLGTELNAGFEKTDTVERIFIFEDVTAPPEGVTIGKLISDVEALMDRPPGGVAGLSPGDIEGKLTPIVKPGSPFNINAIKITLATVYLKMEKPSGASKYTAEYAFRINVDMQGLIRDDIKLINIQQVTLAVWNTDDPKVKQQLVPPSSPSP
jgi:hypothetical protein